MNRAIGMIEFSSIAKGIAITDVMLKAGSVSPVFSETFCPGKYMTLLEGAVGAVQSAVQAGKAVPESRIIHTLVLPNIHEGVFSALMHETHFEPLASLGIIETKSMTASIIAADAALKAAAIRPVRLRLGALIGGKGCFIYTGDLSAVQTALQAARNVLDTPSQIVALEVIPSPVPALWDAILGKLK